MMVDQSITATMDWPEVVTYVLRYRIAGPLYPKGAPARERTLAHVQHGHEVPVRTDEDAVEALREFIARPWANAAVEVVHLTKVTTVVAYEDVTHLAHENGSYNKEIDG